jgi:hypothetical protein
MGSEHWGPQIHTDREIKRQDQDILTQIIEDDLGGQAGLSEAQRQTRPAPQHWCYAEIPGAQPQARSPRDEVGFGDSDCKGHLREKGGCCGRPSLLPLTWRALRRRRSRSGPS